MRTTDYLMDPTRSASSLTREERGVLALLEGMDTYTRLCAPHYADPCAAIEMGVPQMFDAARSMLSYAPESLRRGAISSEYDRMLREWHIDPDTLTWVDYEGYGKEKEEQL